MGAGCCLRFVQRCVCEVLASEGYVKKGETCGLGGSWMLPEVCAEVLGLSACW